MGRARHTLWPRWRNSKTCMLFIWTWKVRNFQILKGLDRSRFLDQRDNHNLPTQTKENVWAHSVGCWIEEHFSELTAPKRKVESGKKWEKWEANELSQESELSKIRKCSFRFNWEDGRGFRGLKRDRLFLFAITRDCKMFLKAGNCERHAFHTWNKEIIVWYYHGALFFIFSSRVNHSDPFGAPPIPPYDPLNWHRIKILTDIFALTHALISLTSILHPVAFLPQ